MMPKPTIGQTDWGGTLNDYLDEQETKVARVDPGTTGPSDHAVVVESGAPAWVPRADGRSRVLLYHDFTGDTNGNPNGRTVEVGGLTWGTSGGTPPTVSSGSLGGTGSGYLYATAATTPHVIEGEFSLSGTNGSGTLCFCRSGGASLLHNIVHFQWSETGGTLAVDKDNAGVLDQIFAVRWALPVDSTRIRIRMVCHGDRVVIYGPNGTPYAVHDPRISYTLQTWTTAFWQAADDCRLHTAALYGEDSSGVSAGSEIAAYIAPPSLVNQSLYNAAGARYESAQVSIGGASGDAHSPSIVFGAAEIRATLLASVSIGGSTFQTDYPFVSGGTVKIGYGTDLETVTTSGTSAGASSPFTTTITGTFAKAHSAGAPVVVTPTGTPPRIYRDLYGSGLMILPSSLATTGTLEIGTARDTAIQRSAAGTLAVTGPGGNKAVYKTGSGTTAQRPTASTVGVGSMYFDTTLGYMIYSNGTNWVNHAGSTV